MNFKKANILGIGVFTIIILVSLVSSIYINSGLVYISNNARIINYAGIVRGGSQRLIKLELSGNIADDMIERNFGIISGLLEGSQEFELIPPADTQYINGVLTVKRYFENEIMPEIEKQRLGIDNDLLSNSEVFFQLCDDMVLIAEKISVQAVVEFKMVNSAILLINLLVTLFAFRLFINSKNKEIQDIEFVDKITGGFNANKFKSEAKKFLKHNKSYTIGYFDIKNVRLLNDNIGYQNGNRLLKIINRIFLQELQNNEIIGRSVADEFYILIQSDKHENIIEKIDKIFDSINIEFNNHLGINYPLSFYCGLYDIVDDEDDIDVVADKARHAHLEAKMEDSVKILFYDEKIHLKILNEINVQNVMFDAMYNEEFKVFLQPKFLTKTKKLCGAESLTRWIKSDNEIIYPPQFIHIFEKNGFIVRLDMHILSETCKLIRQWIENGIDPVPVSVNFSRRHLNNDDFVDEIEKIVDNHNIPHNLIEVEMTESVAIENMDMMNEKAKMLREKGFLLSMDDFGSGHSSLGVLQNLDFDIIKLDKSFIRNYASDVKSTVVLSNIFHMTKELKLKSVAEGIEDEEQYQLMLDLGCDVIQGFYFSKPVPSEEFIKFFP